MSTQLGFINPTIKYHISEKLKKFLDKQTSNPPSNNPEEPTNILTHIEVTIKFMNYCKSNNLQDHNNMRLIIVNNELSDLLNIELGERISYMEAGTQLLKHYRIGPAP